MKNKIKTPCNSGAQDKRKSKANPGQANEGNDHDRGKDHSGAGDPHWRRQQVKRPWWSRWRRWPDGRAIGMEIHGGDGWTTDHGGARGLEDWGGARESKNQKKWSQWMVDQGNVTGLEDQGGAREMDPQWSKGRQQTKLETERWEVWWIQRDDKPLWSQGPKRNHGLRGPRWTRGLNVAGWVDLGCHETTAAAVELQGWEGFWQNI